MEKAKKYVWRQVPLFRYLWPFVLGVGLGIFLNEPTLSDAALLASIVTTLLGYLLFRLYANSLAVLLSFIMIGFSVATATLSTRLDSSQSELASEESIWLVETKGRVEFKNDRLRLIGELKHGVGFDDQNLAGAEVLFYLKVDSNFISPCYGDLVILNSRISSIQSPPNPGMFDFKKYMATKGVGLQGWVDQDEWRVIRRRPGIKQRISRIHHAAVAQLNHDPNWSSESAILSALLLGNKSFLDVDQKSAFANAGAMHVLAVSGLHVGIIYLILLWLTRPLGKKRVFRFVKTAIIVLSLWAFAGITGFSPSVVRSSTMFSFMAFAGFLDRKSSGLNSLIASAMLMLVINPMFLLDVGFQLSYVAVAGIIVIHPRMHGLWKPKWLIIEKLWSLTAVSIAAQIATFPLGIYYFHQFPNYFLLSNLIVIPAVSVILPFGMLMISLAWLPRAYDLIEIPVYTSIRWLNAAIAWISDLPLSTLSGLEISLFELGLIYALIASLIGFVIVRRFQLILVALSLGCLLQGSRLDESLRNQQQRLLTVYSVRGMEAMDFISGNAITSFSENMLKEDREVRYHISPFRSMLNANVVDKMPEIEPVIMCDGLITLNLKDSLEIGSEMTSVDILHIQARTFQKADEILKLTKPEVVVLSPNLEWTVRSYWTARCHELGYELHDLRSQGAFIRYLDRS